MINSFFQNFIELRPQRNWSVVGCFRRSPFLNIGSTSAILKQSGKTPVSKHILISLLSMGAIMNLLNLRNFVSESFDLVAFLVDRESITLIIS